MDYPDRELDRLTTLLRPFVALPILVVLGSVIGESWHWSVENGTVAASGTGGLLFFGPLLIALFFLRIAAVVVVVVAWVAILFTGRYPRGLFDFVQGVIRWHNRVVGYALILVTDRYPPFRLAA